MVAVDSLYAAGVAMQAIANLESKIKNRLQSTDYGATFRFFCDRTVSIGTGRFSVDEADVDAVDFVGGANCARRL